jgi:hypothetical protein
MNLNNIRTDNNKAIRKYERYGTRLFLKALQDQAENFDPEIMYNAYINFYQFVFTDAAKRSYTQIRKEEAKTKDFVVDGFFLSSWRFWIKDYVMKNLVTAIASVNENTRLQIQTITANLLSEGFNPNQIAVQIKKLVGSRSRAVAIARTEGTTANNLGTRRSAEDWQMQTGEAMYKIWIHSGNPTDPRSAHISAQNKPIPSTDNFNINGSSMQFPGDVNAPLSERVNCLCTHTYLSERLVRKRFPEAL